MTGLFRKSGFGGALVLGGAMGLMGCQPSNDVMAGAPLLLSFSAVQPDGTMVAAASDAAPATPPPVLSPRSTFAAVFDRLLDPGAIEVADPDAGLTSQLGVAMMTSTPVVDPGTLEATYIPNGAPPAESGPQVPDGGGPAVVPVLPAGPQVLINPKAAMPCAATISLVLNPLKLRSHDQRLPFQPKDDTVKSTFTFMTEPFTAVITIPMVGTDGGTADDGGGVDGGISVPDVPADSVAHVKFNTLVADDIAAQIHVTVTQEGSPLPDLGSPVRDPSDPTEWNVAPPDTGWPPGVVVTIEVAGDAQDGYGVKLDAAPAPRSFKVAS